MYRYVLYLQRVSTKSILFLIPSIPGIFFLYYLNTANVNLNCTGGSFIVEVSVYITCGKLSD